jgi:hypothetical protein
MLARELGYVDVDGMLDMISAEQFMEWIAFLGMTEKDLDKQSAAEFEQRASRIYGSNR